MSAGKFSAEAAKNVAIAKPSHNLFCAGIQKKIINLRIPIRPTTEPSLTSLLS